MATYLITGCSRGLGLAMTSRPLSIPPSSPTSPSTIFATARSESPALKEVIAKSSGRAVFIPLETTNEASIKNAVSEVEKVLAGKGLDVLINNAGIMPWTNGGIETMTDLGSVLDTNVVSVRNVTAAFLPLLKKRQLKKVAKITSTLGPLTLAPKSSRATPPDPFPYKISKSALNMPTVQYALQYASENFIFMAISPGWLKTDLGSQAADLPVEVGAEKTLDKILAAGKEQNGEYLNIHVPGWENVDGPNKYDGNLLVGSTVARWR